MKVHVISYHQAKLDFASIEMRTKQNLSFHIFSALSYEKFLEIDIITKMRIEHYIITKQFSKQFPTGINLQTKHKECSNAEYPQLTVGNSINLEVSLLIKARTLPRTPHNEVSTVAVVVKPLLTGAEEEVRLLAETGAGLITEGQLQARSE